MGILAATGLAVLISAAQPLVYFDMAECLRALPDDSVLRYDTLKFVASLQGVANREKPRLAIRFMEGAGPGGPMSIDDYWFGKMRQHWLKDTPVERFSDLGRLMTQFRPECAGVVLWDPNVPATANVAATICGVEGWLPVRADSAFAAKLREYWPDYPVKMNLEGRFDGHESGSAKCDAYLWAMREYLETGRCNPALMAYFIDAYTQVPDHPGFNYHDLHNATLANHDYYIARRAFFFDLGVWADEASVDEPTQKPGTDRATLIALLNAQYRRNGGKTFSTVGGFIPWNLKYTNHGPAGGTHEPVPTEWEYAAILSAHNALMDADALGLSCLANASTYAHFPLAAKYKQNPRQKLPPLQDKTYVLVYMGDYDSAAWLSSQVAQFWDEPERGSIPIAWAFNPNLSDRVPYVFDHVYRTKTGQDWFIGGDSGAGYINPNLLCGERLGSGLPDALDLWVEHNQKYYRQFDYSVTGFVINGFHGKMPLRIQKAYARFSPEGVGMQLSFERPMVHGTPFLRHVSDIYPKLDHLEVTADEMAAFVKGSGPRFLIFRWIIQRPSTLKKVQDLLAARHADKPMQFCDPHTFFGLYKRFLNQ